MHFNFSTKDIWMPSTLKYCALALAFIFCLSIEKTIFLDDSGRTEITRYDVVSTLWHLRFSAAEYFLTRRVPVPGGQGRVAPGHGDRPPGKVSWR